MEKKKLLACALAAFTVVAAAPIAADVTEMKDTGTLLAAACGGGCGAKRNVAYNEQSCNQQRKAPSYGQGCNGQNGQRGNVAYNNSPRGYQADNTQSSPSSYDASSGNAGYSADRSATQDWSSSRTAAPSASEAYRSYATDANEYNSKDSSSMTPSSMTPTMSEADFQRQLTSQGKAMYQSLDAEGKALARQIGSQSNYADKKDQAVQEAQRRQAEKRGTNTAGTSSWNR